MIKSIKHKGLRRFHRSGNISGIQAKHAKKLKEILVLLNTAKNVTDMDIPGFNLHMLKGDRAETWSVKVSGNWRLTFEFKGSDAYVVDYEDYH